MSDSVIRIFACSYYSKERMGGGGGRGDANGQKWRGGDIARETD